MAFHNTFASAPILAPEEVLDAHLNIEQKFKSYYRELNYLTNGQMSFPERDNNIKSIISEYYAGDTVAVYNDYESKGIQHLRVQEYLNNLAVGYSEDKKGFGFSDPQVNVSEIFLKDNGENFFVKVEITRTFYCSADHSNDDVQTIDYYVKFYPNSKNYKIYTMAKHENNTMEFKRAIVQSKMVLSSDNINVPIPNPSYFVFNVVPGDAEVKIDGKSVYVVNNMNIPVQAGKHKIEISAPGYESYTSEESYAKEGQNNFAANLRAKMGSLSILNKTRKEIGASVYVDGKLAGTIPAERIPLSEGKHAVRIIKNGYFISSRKVNIEDQSDESVKVFLVNVENTKRGVAIGISIFNQILNSAPPKK
ncbi:MAG: Amylopullulanase, family [Bacteroidetes bacterium]|nr:Amylopullulanase, family [Bacteroidota bacterium]